MDTISFQEIKDRVGILDVVPMLNLKLRQHGEQWRGRCPACSGDDRSLVLTEGKGYYCFKQKRGGDVIALVSHISGLAPLEAAKAILLQFPPNRTKADPTGQQKPTGDLQPLPYLVYDHESVDAMKLTPDVAEALGIGFAPKGMMRSRVVVPLRLPNGRLVGYLGLHPDADVKFPTNIADRI